MTDKMTVEQVDLRKSGATDAIRTEELASRRRAFADKGFSIEWINVLETQRPTLYSPLVLESHITGLKKHGFSNPNKMIESSPAILGYAFENIDAKLAGLKERGFSNPNRMIESLPAILGLAFENIDRRLMFLRRAINLYGLPFEPPFLMENIPFLFSSKIGKILVLARIIRAYNVKTPDINTNLIKKLLSANLEDILVALSRAFTQNQTIEDLIKSSRRVKNEDLTREDKRQIISEDLKYMEKIKRKYFNGYPDK